MDTWSADHIAALLVTLVTVVVLVVAARRSDAWAARAGRALAAVILAAYLGEHLTYAIRVATRWALTRSGLVVATDAVRRSGLVVAGV